MLGVSNLKEVKYCLEVWGTDYQKIKETCLTAERLGYYGFYYGESLTDIDLDCWTVLASMIPLTETIKLGPVITYILPQYRSIPLLAKQCISFQDISNGRLEFRTGSGAPLKYSHPWWNPYGIKYHGTLDRFRIFSEGIDLLSRYFGKPVTSNRFLKSDSNNSENNGSLTNTVNFDGEFFKAYNAQMKPPKKDIPITIAAQNSKMIQIAARYAATWEISYIDPHEFKIKNQELNGLLLVSEMKEMNNAQNYSKARNITKSVELDVIIAETSKALEVKKKIFEMERGINTFNAITQKALIGTPDTVRARIEEYKLSGVTQFLLVFLDPHDLDAIELFMDCVK